MTDIHLESGEYLLKVKGTPSWLLLKEGTGNSKKNPHF
jgi:hypothetical protein